MKNVYQCFVLILTALSGCNTAGDLERIRQAELVWSRNNASDYTLTYRLNYYRPRNKGAIEVKVVEGRVQDARFIDEGQRRKPSNPLTVDKLYVELKNYMKRGYNIEFQYNEKTGVPTYIRLEHPKGMDSVVTFELLKFAIE